MKFQKSLDVSVDTFVNKDSNFLNGIIAEGMIPKIACPICSKDKEYLVGFIPKNSENGYVIWSLVPKKRLDGLLWKYSIKKLDDKTCHECNLDLEADNIIDYARNRPF